MASLLSQLESFARTNLCLLLVGALVLVLYYVYYVRGKSGMVSLTWKQEQDKEHETTKEVHDVNARSGADDKIGRNVTQQW